MELSKALFCNTIMHFLCELVMTVKVEEGHWSPEVVDKGWEQHYIASPFLQQLDICIIVSRKNLYLPNVSACIHKDMSVFRRQQLSKRGKLFHDYNELLLLKKTTLAYTC